MIRDGAHFLTCNPQRALFFVGARNSPQRLPSGARRQYVIITLGGEVEIETGDGTVRRFGPGDVMLADDTSGRGHMTRVVGGRPRDCVMISLK
jgi:hypothetical protein